MAYSNIKALVFDLMGTCCDWHSSLLPILESAPHVQDLNLAQLAANWRAGFFEEIHRRFEAKEAPEDIDLTHRRVLDRLLSVRNITLQTWNDDVREGLVQQWHHQVGWPDAIPALTKLRTDYFL